MHAPHQDRPPLHVVACNAGELVLFKPPGVAADATHARDGSTVIERVQNGHLEGVPEGALDGVDLLDAKLPHRLDKVTCGLMVVAFNGESIAHHNEMLRNRAWQKYYLARVVGSGDPSELLGQHKAYIKEHNKRAECVRSGGKPAFMTVLAAEGVEGANAHGGEAYVLVKLETGRYHQIRVMLANIGWPLDGDELYGGPRGTIYLEHALLGYVPSGADEMHAVVLEDHPWRPGDLPESLRERLFELADELEGLDETESEAEDA